MGMKYYKLFDLLSRKGMKKTDLLNNKVISSPTLAKLSKGETVTTEILSNICEALNCQPGDIMEYVPNQSNPNHSDSRNRINEGSEWHNQRTEDYSDIPVNPNALISRQPIHGGMNQHTENR